MKQPARYSAPISVLAISLIADGSGPALIVPNLPSVVETLPSSTKPGFSIPRAVVKPGKEPLKNSDTWPAGDTRPFGVNLMIVVPVP